VKNRIDDSYLDIALHNLMDYFGIVDEIDHNLLLNNIRKGRVEEAVKMIAQQYGLPIKVNIIYVSEHYKDKNSSKFTTTQMTKRDREYPGSEGITAQVEIPGNLPFFGSRDLENYPITVKICKRITEFPASFALIMAHEFAHVLLSSLSHCEKSNEFYTDLTALVFGFRSVFLEGSKAVTHSSSYSTIYHQQKTTETIIEYGYLSTQQLNNAIATINSILFDYTENVIVTNRCVEEYVSKLQLMRKLARKFRFYHNEITKTKLTKLKQSDADAISSFYHPNFYDELFESISSKEKFLTGFKHEGYRLKKGNKYPKTMEKRVKKIKCRMETLDEEIEQLKHNIRVINRNLNLIKRFRLSFQRVYKTLLLCKIDTLALIL